MSVGLTFKNAASSSAVRARPREQMRKLPNHAFALRFGFEPERDASFLNLCHARVLHTRVNDNGVRILGLGQMQHFRNRKCLKDLIPGSAELIGNLRRKPPCQIYESRRSQIRSYLPL